MDEYLEGVKGIQPMSSDIYRYLNFHLLPEYQDVANEVKVELI
jgi:aconitase B